MITVIEQSTKERKQEIQDKMEAYFDLYYNSNLSVKEIRKKLDITFGSEIYKAIQKRQRFEKVSPVQRGRLILNDNWVKSDAG